MARKPYGVRISLGFHLHDVLQATLTRQRSTDFGRGLPVESYLIVDPRTLGLAVVNGNGSPAGVQRVTVKGDSVRLAPVDVQGVADGDGVARVATGPKNSLVDPGLVDDRAWQGDRHVLLQAGQSPQRLPQN